MNLSTEQKQTHRHREQTCGCQGEGSRGGKDWEWWISRCKLLYIGWINNKVLLYATGNHTQYPVINHHGKEHECLYLSNCVTWLYSRDWYNTVNLLYVN